MTSACFAGVGLELMHEVLAFQVATGMSAKESRHVLGEAGVEQSS